MDSFLLAGRLHCLPITHLFSRWRRYAAAAISTVLAMLSAVPQAATLSATVRDGAGAAVADAVVYAVPVAGAATASRGARNVVIEQVGREFVPYVTVVQVGTTVAFPNRDRLLHHVYSFSPAKTFEIKLYSGAAPFDVLFDKVGVVTIGCNIHDWMIAYVYVVDTPYFARSDATGRAAIGEMAAGDYDLHLWHPQQRSQPAVMRVKLDGKAGSDLALTIDVAPRRQKFKPPANPAAYQ